MAREKNYGNNPGSLIAMILLSFLIIVICMAGFGLLTNTGDAGIVMNLFSALVEAVPFGHAVGEIAVELGATLLNQSISTVITIHGEPITPLYILKELIQMLITAGLYEGLLVIAKGITGLLEPEGFWNRAKVPVLTMDVAYLAAMLSAVAMVRIETMMQSFSTGLQWVLGIVTGLVAAGGLFAILNAAMNAAIGLVIGKFVVKFLLLDGLKLIAIYVLIMLMLLAARFGNIAGFIGSYSALLVLVIIMYAVGKMVDSVFG